MAPAGVFWAAAGARVAFWCARGKSGGVMVLLGAKEGGKSSGRGGTRVAVGQRMAASSGAPRGGSGPFKASQGRRGRRVGVSVARGIEGRPRSAAQAGAWPGSWGAMAASWRVVERSSFAACSSTEQSAAGSTGREGSQRAGAQARHSWPGSEHDGAAAQRARVLECPAARAGMRKGGERKRVERERERSTC